MSEPTPSQVKSDLPVVIATSLSGEPVALDDPAFAAASPESRVLIAKLGASGWRVVAKQPRRWRLWCSGSHCRHQLWVSLNPKSLTYFDDTRNHLVWTTCWKEEPKP